jgi:chromosomal replication initiator protein
MELIWNKVKVSIKKQIPDHCYRMWIEPLDFQRVDNDKFILNCPNVFSRRRIKDNYGNLIQDEIQTATNDNYLLELAVIEKNRAPDKSLFEHQQMALPNMICQPYGGRLFRKDFTFDQFVVSGNNHFAYSAAFELAGKKNSQQNSLFLLAKTGMGKSHLSQAIGHYILSKFPTERVIYMTAEDFTNEMVNSFKKNAIGMFKDKYQKCCDVLLLEDVQYLSGKARTQIELANTFDTLFNANKKIIFSSCSAPSEIPKLNDTLRSRLTSGIVSNIDTPDYQTRLRIIRKKLSVHGQKIPNNVIEYLAGELTEDVRQLESGLIGVAARASLLGIPIDLQLARGVIENIVSKQSKTVTIEGIKKLVCKYYNVTLKDLLSRSRKQAIVKPRQIAIYLSRRYTDQTLQVIGKSFNRYHATAMHAIDAVEKGIKQKTAIQKHVEYLTKKIESGQIHSIK